MIGDIDQHLGNRVRRRRRLLGLTQLQLAEKVGVRFQQVQKYECGANRMSASRVWQLAMALEVPVAYFYCEDDRLAEFLVQYESLDPRRKNLVLEFAAELSAQNA